MKRTEPQERRILRTVDSNTFRSYTSSALLWPHDRIITFLCSPTLRQPHHLVLLWKLIRETRGKCSRLTTENSLVAVVSDRALVVDSPPTIFVMAISFTWCAYLRCPARRDLLCSDKPILSKSLSWTCPPALSNKRYTVGMFRSNRCRATE